jgi:hypothetical protein
MRQLVFIALAIIFVVPHLIAGSVYSSVQADAGYYAVLVPPYGVQMYPCEGDGVTLKECGGGTTPEDRAYFSGTAHANFVGGTIDTFGATLLDMQQSASNYPNTFGEVKTVAGFNAYGVASGGIGPGTLTYDIAVFGVEISGTCQSVACSSTVLPGFVTPGPLSSAPCPTNNNPDSLWEECFEGVVNFTYGVPFPFRSRSARTGRATEPMFSTASSRPKVCHFSALQFPAPARALIFPLRPISLNLRRLGSGHSGFLPPWG